MGPTEMKNGVCRGCGAPVFWVKAWNKEKTKRVNVPCDVRPVELKAAYVLTDPACGKGHLLDQPVLTSHFLTCPKADRFSGRNR